MYIKEAAKDFLKENFGYEEQVLVDKLAELMQKYFDRGYRFGVLVEK